MELQSLISRRHLAYAAIQISHAGKLTYHQCLHGPGQVGLHRPAIRGRSTRCTGAGLTQKRGLPVVALMRPHFTGCVYTDVVAADFSVKEIVSTWAASVIASQGVLVEPVSVGDFSCSLNHLRSRDRWLPWIWLPYEWLP